MGYTFTEESFASLDDCRVDTSNNLNWSSVFILPPWLKAWWQTFGGGAELYLRAVRDEGKVIGIVPMQIRDGVASIIGSADVCDYVDFIVVPGREADFYSLLLDDLKQRGVKNLEIWSLRPESTVLIDLLPLAEKRHYVTGKGDAGVSLETELPASWDAFLDGLDKKQRHEVRRKLRRLDAAGAVSFRCLAPGDGVKQYLDAFLRLFSMSQGEKAYFMTPPMQSFFRNLSEAMAGAGLLRFGVIEVGNTTAAMILNFDYRGTVYLYNSAYDPAYDNLSVGLLCKVLCIKDSIASARKKWDFLKGDEPYKYHIGGKEVHLSSCKIAIQ